MKKTWPFYLITISIFIGIVGSSLLSDGMFFDGVFYANFSRAMAADFQGFWTLKDCLTCEKLYGHPPLAVFLESIWFYVLGNSLYVERVYSISTYFISGLLVHYIFKTIRPKKAHFSFVAIFLWIVFPLVYWGAANNMLENTMTIFVLSSVLSLQHAAKSKKNHFIVLAGVFIFLAFLCKGFVGTFPLAFFILYWLIFKTSHFSDILFKTAILLLSFLSPFVCIYLFSEQGANYLNNYFSSQVLNSLQSELTVSSRFYIVWSLINELLSPAIIVFVFWIFNRKNMLKADFKPFIFFFSLGLLGVLPIMISLKQSSFYIISALPFFAIAISFLITDFFKLDETKFQKLKYLKPISLILFVISVGIMFSQVGKIGRDKTKLEDIYSVLNYTDEKNISIHHELFWDWALNAYFLRYGAVYLNAEKNDTQNLFLIEKNKQDVLLENYNLVKNISLKKYDLYQRKPEKIKN